MVSLMPTSIEGPIFFYNVQMFFLQLGCYPKCPPAQPFFDEDTMTCFVKEQCGCYDKEGRHYNNGDNMPTTENCQIW